MAKSIKAAAVKVVTVMAAIGLDLADMWSDWVGLDENGVEVRRERVKTTEAELRRVFGAIEPTKMAIEVGTHSAWVMRVLSSLGHRVVVANARRVALISRNKRKNNRIDAEFLARLLRSDEKLLFPIRHREARGQADLAVLRSRDVVVACRTKLINHVRGVCKTVGTKLPKCSAEAFVVRCSEHVPESLRLALNSILEQIVGLTAQIKTYDRQITAMIKRYPEVERVRQITGVGELTGLAFILTVEDPQRIVRSRSAGAYFASGAGQ